MGRLYICNGEMKNMNSIKYCPTIILFIILLILNQSSSFTDVLSVILSLLTLIYILFNLPLFRIKNILIRSMLSVNSIVLILVSLNISLITINKQIILLGSCLIGGIQIVLFLTLRDHGDFLKEYQRVEQFHSKLDTSDYFKLINYLSYTTVFLPLLFYRNGLSYIIIALAFLNILFRVIRANLLIKLYFADKQLLGYLKKLLIIEFMLVLVLLVLLLIFKEIWWFISLSLFSNFVVPFLRQKEYEKSNIPVPS